MTVSSDGADRAAIRAALGVDLREDLLGLALTHRSFAYENGVENNERLEWLGDSVLGFVVSTRMFREHPELDDSQLSTRRSTLVSTVALATIARQIGLGPHVRLGVGEERDGGRNKDSILADTTEALIGAVYLDQGFEAARALVDRLVALIEGQADALVAIADPKASIAEFAQLHKAPQPEYRLTESGPDHARVFEATVLIGGGSIPAGIRGHGVGTSKKNAKTAAALDAFHALQRIQSGAGREAPAPADA